MFTLILMTNKIKLNKEPDNRIGKSETLHHTSREQKLDVEKESHTKIQIKPENKISHLPCINHCELVCCEMCPTPTSDNWKMRKDKT